MALCLLYPLCLLCPTLHGMPPGTQVQLPPSQPLLDPLVMLQHDWNAHQPRFFRGEMSLRSTRLQKLQLTGSQPATNERHCDPPRHFRTMPRLHNQLVLSHAKSASHENAPVGGKRDRKRWDKFHFNWKDPKRYNFPRCSQVSGTSCNSEKFTSFTSRSPEVQLIFLAPTAVKDLVQILFKTPGVLVYVHIYRIHIYNHIHLYTSIFIYYTVMYICFQNIHWKSKKFIQSYPLKYPVHNSIRVPEVPAANSPRIPSLCVSVDGSPSHLDAQPTALLHPLPCLMSFPRFFPWLTTDSSRKRWSVWFMY